MRRHTLYRIPPTRTLVTFESAARHRSFSQAARELGIFQSAVSRQISTLEQWTSMRLFERSPAGVSLTQAGRRLHEAAGDCAGVLTEEGRGNPLAHKCVDFFRRSNADA